MSASLRNALSQGAGTKRLLSSEAIPRLFKHEDVIVALAKVLFDNTDVYDVDVDWSGLEKSKRQVYAGVIERILNELVHHVDRLVILPAAGPTTA